MVLKYGAAGALALVTIGFSFLFEFTIFDKTLKINYKQPSLAKKSLNSFISYCQRFNKVYSDENEFKQHKNAFVRAWNLIRLLPPERSYDVVIDEHMDDVVEPSEVVIPPQPDVELLHWQFPGENKMESMWTNIVDGSFEGVAKP